jgi:hypothetical protein
VLQAKTTANRRPAYLAELGRYLREFVQGNKRCVVLAVELSVLWASRRARTISEADW